VNGYDDLDQTWSKFSIYLQKLKRWYYERCKRAGREVRAVGEIEPKLSKNRQVWSLHIHLILEIDEDDKEALMKKWLNLIQAKNDIGAVCEWVGRVENIEARANYITKLDWRCPNAGELEDEVLEAFMKGIYGRRHLISWGFRKPSKNQTLHPAGEQVANDLAGPLLSEVQGTVSPRSDGAPDGGAPTPPRATSFPSLQGHAPQKSSRSTRPDATDRPDATEPAAPRSRALRPHRRRSRLQKNNADPAISVRPWAVRGGGVRRFHVPAVASCWAVQRDFLGWAYLLAGEDQEGRVAPKCGRTKRRAILPKFAFYQMKIAIPRIVIRNHREPYKKLRAPRIRSKISCFFSTLILIFVTSRRKVSRERNQRQRQRGPGGETCRPVRTRPEFHFQRRTGSR
jgi:hypothetical protein